MGFSNIDLIIITENIEDGLGKTKSSHVGHSCQSKRRLPRNVHGEGTVAEPWDGKAVGYSGERIFKMHLMLSECWCSSLECICWNLIPDGTM